MMNVDNPYDDLTALFAAEDDGLAADDFVKDVMAPIRRPSSWRSALLYCATGVGLGAAGSQFVGLLQNFPKIDFDVGAELTSLQVQFDGVEIANPIWLGSILVVVACLAMLTIFERA